MGYLKIQVLGKGMIPRGFGLAPRKEPFNADYLLIGTIISTPGLKVNYLNPESGKLLPLTGHNVKRIWDKYSEWKPGKKAVETSVDTVIKPVIPPDVNKSEEKKEEAVFVSVPGTATTTSDPNSITTTYDVVDTPNSPAEDTVTSTGTISVIPNHTEKENHSSNDSNSGVLRPQYNNNKNKNKHK